ncbi:Rieske (2Fe-2S) protein [Miltoncostaea marina]|uniref:Rieske (2Fe-2S) protein n=1 Tax=Miltoncostaea marina TaxID=2843215 RepID=UPI001C3C876C|nr:Rieske 2Fe-2S domain-containing protein [Miltoncostaea marina]
MSRAPQTVEHALGPIDRIPLGGGREFAVAGVRIAVFRPRAGGVRATAAECPHRGGRMADGFTGMGAVVCPVHGWGFRLDTGEAVVGEGAIACHPVRLGPGGEILVTLPAPARTG